MKDNIYLDNNSTTPIEPRVLDAMLPFLRENFANSNSAHHFGQAVNHKVKMARMQIAGFINAEHNEVIFTSGATESINIAIKGVAQNYSNRGKHIVTISTEHKAVLDTCKDLEGKGFTITYLPVLEDGLVNLADFDSAIRADTILVCVMYVNNETGVIQPIKEMASLVHAKGAAIMVDATQAVGKIDVDVDELNIDLLCFSGHKMYAPKGIGVLYVRKGANKIKLTPQMHGGGHEGGLRSGTLNVPGIVALAKACEIAEEEMKDNEKVIGDLRDRLENELLKLPNCSLNGSAVNRIYNTTNICFSGHDANVWIGRMRNISVSNGSACSSAIVEPSHVLKAMKLTDEDAFASLRFSLGKYNTGENIDTVIEKIRELTQSS
ncbi:IscS subfamily cysteine desulfurase [Dyadobacter luteus]|uniref:cysteine desulfurase n=1 Tax=Dyadobacter luteus TaxID=2259619 RepID=A0A3D8Y636_9BACT|nr:cysteine desulfurase family protein [Dyadobacter luteus]REA58220.1 IscS subfamily cysteine desulfurase [Dyadobacter luteus]